MINLENCEQLTAQVRKDTAKVFTAWRKSKGYDLISGEEMKPGMTYRSISVTIDPKTKEVVRTFTSLFEVISIRPFITPRGFKNYHLKYRTEAGYEYKGNLPGYMVKATVKKPSLDHPVSDIGCINYHFYSNK